MEVDKKLSSNESLAGVEDRLNPDKPMLNRKLDHKNAIIDIIEKGKNHLLENIEVNEDMEVKVKIVSGEENKIKTNDIKCIDKSDKKTNVYVNTQDSSVCSVSKHSCKDLKVFKSESKNRVVKQINSMALNSDQEMTALSTNSDKYSKEEKTTAVGSSNQTSFRDVDVISSPSTQSQTPPQLAMSNVDDGVISIPENILSPPKSETQTDDANTATSSGSSSSSSPGSESQFSPRVQQMNSDLISPTELHQSETLLPLSSKKLTKTPSAPAAGATTTPKPIKSEKKNAKKQAPINVVVNGSIPKSGKPLVSAMNKKLNTQKRTVRQRKPKTTVAMYESEISDHKIGIKLCIKKSETSSPSSIASPLIPTLVNSGSTATTSMGSNRKVNTNSSVAAGATRIAAPPTPLKTNRKRSRKPKAKSRIDSDDSEYEVKKKKERSANNNSTGGNSSTNSSGGNGSKKVSFGSNVTGGLNDDTIRACNPEDQAPWGSKIPEEVLLKIFKLVIENEGCLPTLIRLGRVCSLWHEVSLTPTLWRTLDLTTWFKDKYRTELKLKWFVDNRCRGCTDLNISNWKVSDINCFLSKLSVGCPNLEGITLSGWKNFTTDHLSFLVDNMKKLQRLDLSSINVEMNASKSAVGLQSLCNTLQTMNGRLTHLYLAHNRLAGIPQIVNILSTHCPNLLLLDLSNVTTQATSHGIIHIEKLQKGCQKLKVLRITNSHVTPSIASMQEQMDSPGFPDLEELSVAVPNDESRVIADEHLQRILKTSSKLKLLDVRGCTRLTHESLIRLPAWDIKHLFLSGCSVTRDVGSGLELIASKWAHSLIELDLAWANVPQPIDNALRALAEKGSESPLAHLNLCGSSVSEEAVKDILANCSMMSSINLSSCRGLPRGVKRLMQGPKELQELRDVLKVQVKYKLPSQLTKNLKTNKDDDAIPSNDSIDQDDDGDGGIQSN